MSHPVRKSASVVIAFVGLVAVGCSSQEVATIPSGPSSVASDGGNGSPSTGNISIQSLGSVGTAGPVAGQIKVCTEGNEGGTFDVSVVSGAAAVVGTGHAIAAGTCEVVAETTNGATGATVSVTETPSADLQAVSLNDLTNAAVPFSNGGTVFVNNAAGYTARFFNAAPNSHGCGPGYWKQQQHFDSWALSPNTDVGVAFGLSGGSAGFTLLEGLDLKGGNAHANEPAALIRQAVAALLNAKANINYPLIADPNTPTVVSVGQLIRVLDSSDGRTVTVDFLTSLFEKLNNNFSCSLH